MSRRTLVSALVLAVCLGLAAFLVVDFVEAAGGSPPYKAPNIGHVTHDMSELMGRLEDKPFYNRDASAIVVGLAAPVAAGYETPRVGWPRGRAVTTMGTSGPADGSVTEIRKTIVDVIVGNRTFASSHEVTVSPAAVRAWTREGRIVGRPWSVYAVAGDVPDDTVYVMRDRAGTKVYLVPEHLAEDLD